MERRSIKEEVAHPIQNAAGIVPSMLKEAAWVSMLCTYIECSMKSYGERESPIRNTEWERITMN